MLPLLLDIQQYHTYLYSINSDPQHIIRTRSHTVAAALSPTIVNFNIIFRVPLREFYSLDNSFFLKKRANTRAKKKIEKKEEERRSKKAKKD